MRPAIQLYSLRSLDEPLPAVLERVAEAGYDGVEFAHRVRETDPEAVEDALDRTGLVPVGGHVGLGTLERSVETVADRYSQFGCRDVTVPHLSAAQFRTPARVEAAATRLRVVHHRLADRDFRLHYHTQVQDFLPLVEPGVIGRALTAIHPDPGSAGERSVAGKAKLAGGLFGDALYERLYQRRAMPSDVHETVFAELIDAVPPEVGLQVDAGAVAAAGFDPTRVLELFESRPLSLHLADVAVEQPGPTAEPRSVEAGEGILDVDAVLEAARRAGVEWIIHENDDPRDPETTLARGADILDGVSRERRSTRG